jgi:hypothetical protein
VSSTSAHSASPSQGWDELDLDGTIQSEDEDDDIERVTDEYGDSYASSFHADETELRKLASFTRRCSIVDDGRHGGGRNSNQAQHTPASSGGLDSPNVWWNPKEMERLARYLDKEKKRERRHRQEYDSQGDYDRPRASSDRHKNSYTSDDSRTGASASAHRPESVYSGASSIGTDRSAPNRSAYGGFPREPTLTAKRSFVVFDEELQDYVRLHDPERSSAAPPPPRPPRGTVFSVDELD